MAKFGWDERQLINVSSAAIEELSSAPSDAAAGQQLFYLKSGILYRKEPSVAEVAIIESASSVGASGEAVFSAKSGSDLQFNKIKADSAKITVSTTSNVILIDAALSEWDARFYTETELDAGQLDNRYYTETELDAGQLDNQYFQESEFINATTGVSDAGKPIKTDATGYIDPSFYDLSDIDHGGLSGLADDDHTQYHTDARGDARYYTETELDAGQLDNQYFQESEFLNSSAGAGDAGKPVKLDAAGHIDASMINDADVDHGNLGGLADDDHSQYVLLAGRSGGQIVEGGTDASDDLELKSTDNATKGQVKVIDGSSIQHADKFMQQFELQTTDATESSLVDLALADDKVSNFQVTVVCRRSDVGGEARASWQFQTTAFRAAAGGATLQGSVKQEYKSASQASLDADIDVSSNNVRVRVTGIAAQDFEWKAYVEQLVSD